MGTIVGAAVGGGVFLILAIGVLLFFLVIKPRRKGKNLESGNSKHDKNATTGKDDIPLTTTPGSGESSPSVAKKETNLKSLTVTIPEVKHVVIKKQLGGGNLSIYLSIHLFLYLSMLLLILLIFVIR